MDDRDGSPQYDDEFDLPVFDGTDIPRTRQDFASYQEEIEKMTLLYDGDRISAAGTGAEAQTPDPAPHRQQSRERHGAEAGGQRLRRSARISAAAARSNPAAAQTDRTIEQSRPDDRNVPRMVVHHNEGATFNFYGHRSQSSEEYFPHFPALTGGPSAQNAIGNGQNIHAPWNAFPNNGLDWSFQSAHAYPPIGGGNGGSGDFESLFHQNRSQGNDGVDVELREERRRQQRDEISRQRGRRAHENALRRQGILSQRPLFPLQDDQRNHELHRQQGVHPHPPQSTGFLGRRQNQLSPSVGNNLHGNADFTTNSSCYGLAGDSGAAGDAFSSDAYSYPPPDESPLSSAYYYPVPPQDQECPPERYPAGATQSYLYGAPQVPTNALDSDLNVFGPWNDEFAADMAAGRDNMNAGALWNPDAGFQPHLAADNNPAFANVHQFPGNFQYTRDELIQLDQIACTNAERVRLQPARASNHRLLSHPARGCVRRGCRNNHRAWPTVGELNIQGCNFICEVCGMIVSGPASSLRNHVRIHHVGENFEPDVAPTERRLYTSVRDGAGTAILPKNVREWVKATGRPASEYVLPKTHPKYKDMVKGLVSKIGVPTYKATKAKGSRAGKRSGKQGDYHKRNREAVFDPGMWTTPRLRKNFPQLHLEAKEEEENDDGEEGKEEVADEEEEEGAEVDDDGDTEMND